MKREESPTDSTIASLDLQIVDPGDESEDDVFVLGVEDVAAVRAAAWTLHHIVPPFWWSDPPNQATRDVVEGIRALEQTIDRLPRSEVAIDRNGGPVMADKPATHRSPGKGSVGGPVSENQSPRPDDVRESLTRPAISPTEAAAVIGVSRQTVHNLIRRGELRRFKVGRLTRIPTADVLALLGAAHEDVA